MTSVARFESGDFIAKSGNSASQSTCFTQVNSQLLQTQESGSQERFSSQQSCNGLTQVAALAPESNRNERLISVLPRTNSFQSSQGSSQSQPLLPNSATFKTSVVPPSPTSASTIIEKPRLSSVRRFFSSYKPAVKEKSEENKTNVIKQPTLISSLHDFNEIVERFDKKTKNLELLTNINDKVDQFSKDDQTQCLYEVRGNMNELIQQISVQRKMIEMLMEDLPTQLAHMSSSNQQSRSNMRDAYTQTDIVESKLPDIKKEIIRSNIRYCDRRKTKIDKQPAFEASLKTLDEVNAIQTINSQSFNNELNSSSTTLQAPSETPRRYPLAKNCPYLLRSIERARRSLLQSTGDEHQEETTTTAATIFVHKYSRDRPSETRTRRNYKRGHSSEVREKSRYSNGCRGQRRHRSRTNEKSSRSSRCRSHAGVEEKHRNRMQHPGSSRTKQFETRNIHSSSQLRSKERIKKPSHHRIVKASSNRHSKIAVELRSTKLNESLTSVINMSDLWNF